MKNHGMQYKCYILRLLSYPFAFLFLRTFVLKTIDTFGEKKIAKTVIATKEKEKKKKKANISI